MLWFVYYSGTVCVLFHSFFPRVAGFGSWSGSREMWSWFAVLSLFSKNKRQACVLSSFFFHPPSILDLTTLRPHNPICQPVWISVRDLRCCLGCSGGKTGPRSLEEGVGWKIVCMCLTHSEIGFQRWGVGWGEGLQRAIMLVRMCWLLSVLCLPSTEHTRRENYGVGIFLRLENAKVELRKR